MKPLTLIFALLLILLMVGCQQGGAGQETTTPTEGETTTPSQGEIPEVENPPVGNVNERYNLYQLYSTNRPLTDDMQFIYPTPDETIERPLRQTVRKPELLGAGKRLAIGGKDLALTYDRSYNTENSTRLIDIYYTEDRRFMVGLDEETQEIMKLNCSDGYTFTITEAIQTEEQVISACREFLRQYQSDIDRYTPKISTVFFLVNEHFVATETVDGFCLPSETEFSEEDIKKVSYQVEFEYYFQGLLTNDNILMRVESNGNMDLMARFQTGDFSLYEGVTVDQDFCRSIVETALPTMFEEVIQNSEFMEYVSYELKEQLIIVEDYLLVLYEADPTYRRIDPSTGAVSEGSVNPVLVVIPIACLSASE